MTRIAFRMTLTAKEDNSSEWIADVSCVADALILMRSYSFDDRMCRREGDIYEDVTFFDAKGNSMQVKKVILEDAE